MIASLRGAHVAWAWVVIAGNGLAGVWALGSHWRPSLARRQLWWITAAAQVSVLIQVVLGVVLRSRAGVASEDRFHEFYGFIALVAIAILYSYRAQLRHQIHLLYGLGSLFVMGLAIRALLLA